MAANETDGRNPAEGRSARDIEQLRSQIEKYRALEREHKAALDALADKERFNFALFQFSPHATIVVDRDGRVVKSNIAKRKTGDRLPEIGNVMYRDYASRHSRDMYAELMASIRSGDVRRFPELRYGGKTLSVTIAPFPEGAIIISQDITAQKQAELDRMSLIDELRRALEEVEKLRGLLPICASCKRIRDDNGYWNEVEVYFSKHSNVNFSHALCPDCTERLYPEMWKRMVADTPSTPEYPAPT